MTPDELAQLSYFRDGERYITGTPVDWSVVSFATMQILEQLRARLDAPIRLIRADHGPDGSAVDWCCLDRPYSAIVMECLPLACAMGFYAGNSIHTDTRPVLTNKRPARWMAIRPADEWRVPDLATVLDVRKDGWTYLKWSDLTGTSFHALRVVVALAEGERRPA